MRKDSDFQKLIKKDRYQVFLFASPSSIPVNFVPHHWFVLNKKGEISRWEVLMRKYEGDTSWSHLHKDFLPLFQGIEIIPFYNEFFWKTRLMHMVEGEEGSLAYKMIEFIENSPNAYMYCRKYHLTGPNSNTYAQWVLDGVPEFGAKLPWNSFGKGYEP